MAYIFLERRRSRRNDHCIWSLFVSFLLLILSLGVFPATPISTRALENRVHSYRFDIRTIEKGTTYHHYGIQQIRLDLIDSESLRGYISWNFTMDDGNSWIFLNSTKTYDINRTYIFAGFPTYTAWWVAPSVQIGDSVTIDGDAPATSSCTRSGPFLVTDLVSYALDNTLYTCWLLTYDLSNTQHETFYYEHSSGMLIAAYSEITKPGNYSHNVQLELVSAIPSLPVANPLIHLWLSFGHFIIAFIAANLAVTGVYWVLCQIRRRRVTSWFRQISKA